MTLQFCLFELPLYILFWTFTVLVVFLVAVSVCVVLANASTFIKRKKLEDVIINARKTHSSNPIG